MFITIKLYIFCYYSCLKGEIKGELKDAIVQEYNRRREERRRDLMEMLDQTYLECPICLHLVRSPQECSTCKNLLCLACIDGIVRISKCPICRARPFVYAPSELARRLVASISKECERCK
jgi:hypothetical protein